MKWDVDVPDVGKYLLDPARIIVDSHLQKVCKKNQGACACRYISLTISGYVCVKNTPLKDYVDLEADSNSRWKAKGNNCDGFGAYVKENKEDKETE